MKKKIFFVVVSVFIISLSGLLLGQETQQVPKEFASYEKLLSFFYYNAHLLPSSISERGVFQSESLVSDWYDLTIDGRKYVGRLIQTQIVAYNVGEIVDVKKICSVAPGEKYTTREVITTSSTCKISTNITLSIKFSESIGFSLNFGQEISKTKTYVIESGREYQFPSEYCRGFNSAGFYTGTGFDLYKVTLEIAPYEVRDLRALSQCLRECDRRQERYKAIDNAQLQECRRECNSLYGSRPNFDKISTYEFNIYVPVQINWVVCELI